MFHHKGCQFDMASHYTNADLRAFPGKASTDIVDGVDGRFDDSIVADQGNAVFLNQQLLAVGASLDDDLVAGGSGVDGVLNPLARADVSDSGSIPGCGCC
jgi:hypothetical protein